MIKLITKHRPLIYLMSLIFISSCASNNNNWEISSPDNNLKVEIIYDDSTGQVFYRAKNRIDNNYKIRESRLGVIFDSIRFDSSLSFINKAENKNIEEKVELVSGKRLSINQKFNEINLTFENVNQIPLVISFRVFNNGFAFRYKVEESKIPLNILTEEITTFNLPDSGKCWLQPYDLVSKWTPGYERPYTNGTSIGEDAPDSSNGWCFPMLFEVDNSWILISEADLSNNNAGMHIDKNCVNSEYKITLPVEDEAFGICESNPKINLPWQSSWRTILMVQDLTELFESNLTELLASENTISDIDWIKPGRSAWSWWPESDSPVDFKRQIEYIDFAAKMGWEYSLVDANWDKMIGGNIEMLSKYAKTKNVGLLLWYNSGGKNNIVEEGPRDRMSEKNIRRKEFKWMHDLGIKGIKVDFFQSDKQCVIKQYHDILSDAMDYKLVVNFHGCTIPRGWNRTYPNLLTMEAVRGGETYKFGKTYPDEAVLMNTIYPFTRNILGSMDYTPVMFTNHTYPHKTTFSHELATSVVFESGIIHFADSYEAYLKQPEYVIDYLKDIEAAWDNSILLYGYPGKEIGVAREKNNNWFIAGLSSQEESTVKEISLEFLDDKKYTAKIITDGKNQNSFDYKEKVIGNKDKLKIDILPFGGFSIKFSELK